MRSVKAYALALSHAVSKRRILALKHGFRKYVLYSLVLYARVYKVLRILRQIHLAKSLSCHQKQDKQCDSLICHQCFKQVLHK